MQTEVIIQDPQATGEQRQLSEKPFFEEAYAKYVELTKDGRIANLTIHRYHAELNASDGIRRVYRKA